MVQTVSDLKELRHLRCSLAGPVGFVPTMGFLHAGHLALVQAARRDCQSVVVSIFVNPTQFGPQEDLSRYPRDLPRDLALLDEAGVDLVWLPTAEVMYPPGYQTWVTVDEVSQPLEGARRPGHFRGVATVVAKLFHAVQPDRAYFGQKDAQQAVIIRKMTEDLNMPVRVKVMPTIREKDGLAMSSRNRYLSSQERKEAVLLFASLKKAKQLIEAKETSASRIVRLMRAVIQKAPHARIDYVQVVDPDTLQPLTKINRRCLIVLAVRIGKTRLIDNLMVNRR